MSLDTYNSLPCTRKLLWTKHRDTNTTGETALICDDTENNAEQNIGKWHEHRTNHGITLHLTKIPWQSRN